MSTIANPKGKGGKASTNVNNDADSIMPLLFATIGNPTISFKKMAAMDDLGRTESSLEHRFRKWRQKGREIAAQNPGHAGTLEPSTSRTATTKKPRALAKKGANDRGKGPIEQAGVEDEEDETDEEARAVEQEPDEMGGIGGELLHPSIKRKATAINGTKTPATSSQVAAAEDEVGHVPKKKAKVAKKGTAKVVKKYKNKVYSGSEVEDVESEDEGKVPNKSKGEGNGNTAAAIGKAKAAAQPTGPAKAKNGKAAKAAELGQISIHGDKDVDVDMSPEDGHHDGMVEMQFDQAA